MLKSFTPPDEQRKWLAGSVKRPADLVDLSTHVHPNFVLFVAADETDTSAAEWQKIADNLLQAGAVYVVLWGPGCRELENHFDLAYVVATEIHRTLTVPSGSVVMTTSHADESLEEALWFGFHAALPDDAYVDDWHASVAVSVGNNEWYRRIEDYLEAGAPIDAA